MQNEAELDTEAKAKRYQRYLALLRDDVAARHEEEERRVSCDSYSRLHQIHAHAGSSRAEAKRKGECAVVEARLARGCALRLRFSSLLHRVHHRMSPTHAHVPRTDAVAKRETTGGSGRK